MHPRAPSLAFVIAQARLSRFTMYLLHLVIPNLTSNSEKTKFKTPSTISSNPLPIIPVLLF